MTKSKQVRARGRPREFDPTKVDDAIMTTFWRKGFGATTLDDLCEATNLKRPSLYKVIGSKEQAYLNAINRYLYKYGQRYISALNAGGSFSEDLDGFFAAYIDTVTSDFGPGCPIGCVLPVDTEQLAAAKSILSTAISELEKTAIKRYRNARRKGEANPNLSAIDGGKLVVSTMLFLSLRSRAGETAKQLRKSAKSVAKVLTAEQIVDV